MNRLTVTIVDVLGFLVPGLALLFGFVLVPVPPEWLRPVNETLLQRMPLLGNPWVAGGCWLAIAYVLGFLIRLTSISALNLLTWRRSSARLERDAAALDGPLTSALNDAALSEGLKTLANACNERDPGRRAPYFHFAKRLVRTSARLWTEAERLEAEMRFAAGLFLPLLVLSVDGVLIGFSTPAGWLISIICGTGAALILVAFPSRHAKEILYDQFLALVVLKYERNVAAFSDEPNSLKPSK